MPLLKWNSKKISWLKCAGLILSVILLCIIIAFVFVVARDNMSSAPLLPEIDTSISIGTIDAGAGVITYYTKGDFLCLENAKKGIIEHGWGASKFCWEQKGGPKEYRALISKK